MLRVAWDYLLATVLVLMGTQPAIRLPAWRPAEKLSDSANESPGFVKVVSTSQPARLESFLPKIFWGFSVSSIEIDVYSHLVPILAA